MARAVSFTQAKVERAVRAARKVGLRVVGISLSDGVLLVKDGGAPIAPEGDEGQDDGPETRWDDV